MCYFLLLRQYLLHFTAIYQEQCSPLLLFFISANHIQIWHMTAIYNSKCISLLLIYCNISWIYAYSHVNKNLYLTEVIAVTIKYFFFFFKLHAGMIFCRFKSNFRFFFFFFFFFSFLKSLHILLFLCIRSTFNFSFSYFFFFTSLSSLVTWHYSTFIQMT